MHPNINFSDSYNWSVYKKVSDSSVRHQNAENLQLNRLLDFAELFCVL